MSYAGASPAHAEHDPRRVVALPTSTAQQRILLIAFHFPPLAGSSGIQRTLGFVRHLPAFGWETIVLSAHPRAYERTSDDLLHALPDDLIVKRAPAWDTSRHLSIRGRYPGTFARPDRWLSWWPGAVWAGMQLIRRLQPSVIWSTYPIATAHLIGASLARLSGLPWIADFRDPMAQDNYPTDGAVWRRFKAIEERAATRAAAWVFTTPGALRYYRQRYPEIQTRMHVIENGYDESMFDALRPGGEPLIPGRYTLLHSGIVYPSERDPTALFAALHRYKAGGGPPLTLRFRAAVHDTLLQELAGRYGVEDCVDIQPAIPYRAALAEMLRADALLIMQASNCNDQIPAKLYEYLRAGRPVAGLTDPAGDTARTLHAAGIEAIAPLDDSDAIASLLHGLTGKAGLRTQATASAIAGASRRGRTEEFARLLARVAACPPCGPMP